MPYFFIIFLGSIFLYPNIYYRATVKSSGGLVTGKKIGTTTVTATTYNGKKVDCTVVVVSRKNVATVRGSVIKNKAAWDGSTLKSFTAGTKMNQISTSGNWVKVECNGTIGYVYNRAFNNKANYSTINESTLPIVADDLIFTQGDSIKALYNYVAYSVSYTSKSSGSSIESMSVYALKYRVGSCYYQSALMYYLLDRAGYEVERISDGNIYVRGGYHPHTWCIVKTSSGWRHIDPTGIQEVGKSYMTTDSYMERYLTWGKKVGSNKHYPYHSAK